MLGVVGIEGPDVTDLTEGPVGRNTGMCAVHVTGRLEASKALRGFAPVFQHPADEICCHVCRACTAISLGVQGGGASRGWVTRYSGY